jgi:hypothetical protein
MVEVETSGGASPTQNVIPNRWMGLKKGPIGTLATRRSQTPTKIHTKLEHESLKRSSPVFGIVNKKRRVPAASVPLLLGGANV